MDSSSRRPTRSADENVADSLSDEEMATLVRTLGRCLREAIESLPASGPPLWVVHQCETAEIEGTSVSPIAEFRPILLEQTVAALEEAVTTKAIEMLVPVLTDVESLRRRFLLVSEIEDISADNLGPRLRVALVSPIVHHYLIRVDSLRWDEDVFSALGSELAGFLRRPIGVMVVSSALNNFTMSGDLLVIRPGLQIERLATPERQQMYEDARRINAEGFIGALRAGETQFVIRQEFQFTVEHGLGAVTFNAPWHQVLHRVMLALRLHGDGAVASDVTWTGLREPALSWRFAGSMRQGAWGLNRAGGEDLVLSCDSETATALSRRMDLLEQAKPGLGVALRRFELGYTRGGLPEDRVIDAWVGLEALFTTRQERAEQTDKISRRIGRLLGPTTEARRALVKEAKKLYQVRSAIVHGGAPSRDVADAALRSEQILRDAINSRLERGWTVESLEDQMMA